MAATLTQVGNPGHRMQYRGAPKGEVVPVLDMTQASSGGAPAAVAYVTPTRTDVQESIRVWTINLNAYATNGVAVGPNDVGLGTGGTIVQMIIPPAGGRLFEWDNVNGKIKAYQCSAGASGTAFTEVGNATDLSATPVRALVFGIAV